MNNTLKQSIEIDVFNPFLTRGMMIEKITDINQAKDSITLKDG